MRALTVLYDASCDICSAAREWIEREPHYIPVYFMAAGSEEARTRFPDLDHDATLREVTAIDDGGGVYRGTSAWVMCLWVLPAYRTWAARIGGSHPLPGAREFIAWVSRNRHSLAALRPLASLARGLARATS